MKITVRNDQGATDITYAQTRREAQAHIDRWSDPQVMTAYVEDIDGVGIGSKPLGCKRIQWSPQAAKV